MPNRVSYQSVFGFQRPKLFTVARTLELCRASKCSSSGLLLNTTNALTAVTITKNYRCRILTILDSVHHKSDPDTITRPGSDQWIVGIASLPLKSSARSHT